MDRGPARLLDEPLGAGPARAPTKQLFTNSDDAVTIKGESAALHPRERQKKNLDRSLRQFLAGGLAGCAVRHISMPTATLPYT